MGRTFSIWSAGRSPKTLAAGFLASGVVHLVAPGVYEGIVPRWLPRRRSLVYISGVAELVCAGGLLAGTSWSGPASAGLLVAVWPANLQMAIDSTRAHRSWTHQAAAWLRVPMQVPMIRAALRAGSA